MQTAVISKYSFTQIFSLTKLCSVYLFFIKVWSDSDVSVHSCSWMKHKRWFHYFKFSLVIKILSALHSITANTTRGELVSSSGASSKRTHRYGTGKREKPEEKGGFLSSRWDVEEEPEELVSSSWDLDEKPEHLVSSTWDVQEERPLVQNKRRETRQLLMWCLSVLAACGYSWPHTWPSTQCLRLLHPCMTTKIKRKSCQFHINISPDIMGDLGYFYQFYYDQTSCDKSVS